MNWTDIWTEIKLKLNLMKPERARRKMSFRKNDISSIITSSTIVKSHIISEVEERLRNRSITASYLFTDNKLFEPYVDLQLINLQSHDFHSFVFEIGLHLLRIVKAFEDDHRVTVNKTDLYFTLALCSIYSSSTINASIFWELSQKDESNTLGTTYNAAASVQGTIQRFSSTIVPIEIGVKDNGLYAKLLSTHNWVGDFKANLLTLSDPQLFSYFSCGLRNRAIAYLIRNNFTEMTKMYGQELLNALCILSESLLKQNPAVSNHTLGKIINHDLPILNPNVSAIIGSGATTPKTGFWVSFPSGTKSEFDTNFPLLIAHLKTHPVTTDELKACVIWGLYMLRNKALHDYDPTLIYYNDHGLFLDAIGLALLGTPVIKNL